MFSGHFIGLILVGCNTVHFYKSEIYLNIDGINEFRVNLYDFVALHSMRIFFLKG